MDKKKWKLLTAEEVDALPEKELEEYGEWVASFKDKALKQVNSSKKVLRKAKQQKARVMEENIKKSDDVEIAQIRKNLENK